MYRDLTFSRETLDPSYNQWKIHKAAISSNNLPLSGVDGVVLHGVYGLLLLIIILTCMLPVNLPPYLPRKIKHMDEL